MGLTIALVFVFFVFVMFLVILINNRACNTCQGRNDEMYDNDEFETTTTTTTTTTMDVGGVTYEITGQLTVRTDAIGEYVLDPVDGTRTPINAGDDLYEDAGNKVWQLVG